MSQMRQSESFRFEKPPNANIPLDDWQELIQSRLSFG